jgi:hypothetical protein
MRNLFIWSAMILASMSNIGCSMCEKKKSVEEQARACMSSPECMARAQSMAVQAGIAPPPTAPYKVGQNSANGGVLTLNNGQVAPPANPSLAPPVVPAVQSVSDSQIKDKQNKIAAALAAGDPVAAVVPKQDPSAVAANQALLNQNQQVGLQNGGYQSSSTDGDGIR